MTDNPFDLKDPELVKEVNEILEICGAKRVYPKGEPVKKGVETKSVSVDIDVNTGGVSVLMDKNVIQVIHGNIPSKSNCYKIITFKSKDSNKSHASLGKTKSLTQYEKDFFIQCNKYRNAAIDEYFTLEVDVYYPSQRSDLDNCLKVLLDCLQKVNAIKNDNKCVRIVANKFLDAKNPRVEFVIKKAM